MPAPLGLEIKAFNSQAGGRKGQVTLRAQCLGVPPVNIEREWERRGLVQIAAG